MRRQDRDWEKIQAKATSDKGQSSKTHKNSYNNKKTNNPIKRAKDLNTSLKKIQKREISICKTWQKHI